MERFVEESWTGPQNRVGYPLLLAQPPQPHTTFWVDATNDDKARGRSFSNQESRHQSLLVHDAPVGTRWWFRGALPSDTPVSHGETIPGARTLGFYVCVEDPAVLLKLRVVGWDPRGAVQAEEILLTGATHKFAADFQGWEHAYETETSPIPVPSAYYNPNALVLQSSPVQDGKWGRIPVADSFQTTRAWSRLRFLELLSKSDTHPDDVLVPNFKVLAFAPRTPLGSLDDVVGGVVHPNPAMSEGWGWPQPHKEIGLQFHWTSAGGPTGWAPVPPLPSGLKKANLRLDPGNLLRFTVDTPQGADGVNPFVYGGLGRVGDLVKIDQRGELLLGHVDFWVLTLALREEAPG